jgi:hypothetical protein
MCAHGHFADATRRATLPGTDIGGQHHFMKTRPNPLRRIVNFRIDASL